MDPDCDTGRCQKLIMSFEDIHSEYRVPSKSVYKSLSYTAQIARLVT